MNKKCTAFLCLLNVALAHSVWAKVSISSAQPIPRDPVVTKWQRSPIISNGELVYGDYSRLRTAQGLRWVPLIKIVSVSKGRPNRARAYQVQGLGEADRVLDVQFSPNGRSVLFKTGFESSSYSTFQFHVWNRDTNTVRSGPNDLLYRATAWAPNSRQVAYISGGVDLEGNDTPRDPLKLMVYDVATGKSRFVAQNPMVRLFAWTPQNTLLYSVKREGEKNRSFNADIYALGSNTLKPRLFLQNAWSPFVSKSGRIIAFVAWPEAEGSSSGQNQIGFYQYNRDTKQRELLRSSFSSTSFSGFQWGTNDTPIFLRTIQRSPQGRAEVIKLDGNGNGKRVALLSATDYEAIARPTTQPQIQALPQSANALLVRLSEFSDGDATFYNEDVSLAAVDTNSGKVFRLVKIRNPNGLDWRGTK